MLCAYYAKFYRICRNRINRVKEDSDVKIEIPQ